ncbi:MAG TPA: carbohydrate porin [Hydrogenophaga sp.]|nr:carbohydrate porin [Hydrogenophaga sp.]
MPHAFKLVALAALCATAAAAHADVGLDANLELDTTYTNAVDEPATNARDSDLSMGGRVEFNIGAKASNGDAFVAGRASLLLKKDGDTGVDDMWVHFGNAGMDVKLGRFEAMDLFPLGKDTVVEEAGYSAYKTNKLRGRFGSDTVHSALGINAGAARIELGLVYSKDTDAVRGVRPAVSYTTGPVTLRAGVESVKVVGGGKSSNGVGLSLGYKLGTDSNLNLNLAKLEDDKSIGVNAVFGPAGVGLIYGKGATSADKVTTVYAAYALPLFGVKGATITPAISYSKGGTSTDGQVAVRARINYAF